VGVTPVPLAGASRYGLLRTDEDDMIVQFAEKPSDPAMLDPIAAPDEPSGPSRDELAAPLPSLPDTHPAVLLMRLPDDLTPPETGQALGLPEGTVTSRLHNALSALLAPGPLWLGRSGSKGGSRHNRRHPSVWSITHTPLAPDGTPAVWLSLAVVRAGRATAAPPPPRPRQCIRCGRGMAGATGQVLYHETAHGGLICVDHCDPIRDY